MRAAELLLALLAVVVAVSAVLASGWGVAVWTLLLAAPYFMLLLASRQLAWWREARAAVAGIGLVASLVVATVQLRAMGQDTAASGSAVLTAWLVHVGLAVAAMVASAILTIRRVREVQRGRGRADS